MAGRSFLWWYAWLAIALAASMTLTLALLKAGLFVTTDIPLGGLGGPLCFKAGGLLSPDGLFPRIRCIGFPGSSVAGYLLTRGYWLSKPDLGVILLLIECIAAAPVAFALSRLWRRPA
ncbi:MAG: hypothetical protein KDJ68_15825 [Rhodobiaceae bacterium]|nr:hypothetical protein [Rhodobiaceae bacterium]